LLLFKPELAGLIVRREKTQTRRDWRRKSGPRAGEPYPRVRVGGTYQVRTSFYSKPVCRIRVTGLRRQRLGDISEHDAKREGFASVEQFIAAWVRINGRWTPDRVVWVVDFEMVA